MSGKLPWRQLADRFRFCGAQRPEHGRQNKACAEQPEGVVQPAGALSAPRTAAMYGIWIRIWADHGAPPLRPGLPAGSAF